MKQVGELFFPDGEKHFARYEGPLSNYGKSDRENAYRYVKRWRRALDVGANVGIFSRDFATRFEEVVAFEPMPETRQCLKLNVPSNVVVQPFAISNKPASLKMYKTPRNSGAAFIFNHRKVMIPDYEHDSRMEVSVEARTIDSFEFDAVDLIKFDIQGAELMALAGARETILRHRPVILIEEKPFSEAHAESVKQASKLLRKSFGMTAKDKVRSDRVYIFED